MYFISSSRFKSWSWSGWSECGGQCKAQRILVGAFSNRNVPIMPIISALRGYSVYYYVKEEAIIQQFEENCVKCPSMWLT